MSKRKNSSVFQILPGQGYPYASDHRRGKYQGCLKCARYTVMLMAPSRKNHQPKSPKLTHCIRKMGEGGASANKTFHSSSSIHTASNVYPLASQIILCKTQQATTTLGICGLLKCIANMLSSVPKTCCKVILLWLWQQLISCSSSASWLHEP